MINPKQAYLNQFVLGDWNPYASPVQSKPFWMPEGMSKVSPPKPVEEPAVPPEAAVRPPANLSWSAVNLPTRAERFLGPLIQSRAATNEGEPDALAKRLERVKMRIGNEKYTPEQQARAQRRAGRIEKRMAYLKKRG